MELQGEPKTWVVDTRTLSDLLGCSMRTVQLLATDDKLPKHADNQWNLKDCIEAYRKHTLTVAVSRFKDGGDGEGGDELSDEIRAAKLRKAKADASIREIDLEYRQGTLFRAEHVGQVLDAVFGSFHTRLQAIPATMARDVAGMTDLNKIADCLRTGINEAELELKRFSLDELRRFNEQFLADQAARETANPQAVDDVRQDS